MKMFKSLLTLCFISTSLSLPISAEDKILNYEAVRGLKNPYLIEAQSPSLRQGSREYITLNALSDRFAKCQRGLVNFISMANHAVVAKKYFTKSEIFVDRAELIGLEYPFAKSGLELQQEINQIALSLGWDYQGQSPDKIAQIFWNKCTHLPIAPFEKYWREDN